MLFGDGVAADRYNLRAAVRGVVENERSAPFIHRLWSKVKRHSARRVGSNGRAARILRDRKILGVAAGELNARETDRRATSVDNKNRS